MGTFQVLVKTSNIIFCVILSWIPIDSNEHKPSELPSKYGILAIRPLPRIRDEGEILRDSNKKSPNDFLSTGGNCQDLGGRAPEVNLAQPWLYQTKFDKTSGTMHFGPSQYPQ